RSVVAPAGAAVPPPLLHDATSVLSGPAPAARAGAAAIQRPRGGGDCRGERLRLARPFLARLSLLGRQGTDGGTPPHARWYHAGLALDLGVGPIQGDVVIRQSIFACTQHLPGNWERGATHEHRSHRDLRH